MQQKIEIEYKLLLKEEEYRTLLERFPFQVQEQYNVYYDCGENVNVAMRLRQIANERIFTCKEHTTAGLLETEIVVVGEVSTDPQVQLILQKYGITELRKLLEFRTIRHYYRTTQYELSVDQTWFGGIVDYELEYEVLLEHDHAYHFRKLIQELGLHYSQNAPSKLARAKKYGL